MNSEMIQAIANLFNFLLFLFLLVKFAGPAVTKGLADRHATTLGAIRDAEEAQKQAEAALSATSTRLAGVEGELAELVAQAKTMAVAQAKAIEETAETEVDRLRNQAKAEIDRERQMAVDEIRRLMVNQAFDRATLELQQQMNPERQRELVEGMIQKVSGGSLALK